MTHSIRRRLLVGLSVVLCAVWIVATLSVRYEAGREVRALLDAQLSNRARLVLGVLAHEADEHSGSALEDEELSEVEAFVHKYEQRMVFWVWDAGGRPLLRSSGAEPRPLAHARAPGFASLELRGVAHRSFTLSDDASGYVVEVAEPVGGRQALTASVTTSSLVVLLASLPLFAVTVWMGVGTGLRPLDDIAAALQARAPPDVGPLVTGAVPGEVRPLVDELNALFRRVGDALDKERRFTADAAHELRTPLAGLKVQAQVAMRQTDDAARRHALGKLVEGTDRATRLVEQLLTLARMDEDDVRGASEVVDVTALAAEVLAHAQPAADRRSITLTLSPETAVHAAVHADGVTVALRNLVDNAIRYIPSHGSVDVTMRETAHGLCIEVADTGPGIAPEDRERLTGRFSRGNATGSNGNGLGLSIVRRIAELHGGTLSLADAEHGGGLRVLIDLPRRPGARRGSTVDASASID